MGAAAIKPNVLKTGKYRCNVLNCGGKDGCVHGYIQRSCPHCDHQLVRVSTSGHIFCSNHESICDYEEHACFLIFKRAHFPQ